MQKPVFESMAARFQSEQENVYERARYLLNSSASESTQSESSVFLALVCLILHVFGFTRCQSWSLLGVEQDLY